MRSVEKESGRILRVELHVEYTRKKQSNLLIVTICSLSCLRGSLPTDTRVVQYTRLDTNRKSHQYTRMTRMTRTGRETMAYKSYDWYDSYGS